RETGAPPGPSGGGRAGGRRAYPPFRGILVDARDGFTAPPGEVRRERVGDPRLERHLGVERGEADLAGQVARGAGRELAHAGLKETRHWGLLPYGSPRRTQRVRGPPPRPRRRPQRPRRPCGATSACGRRRQ